MTLDETKEILTLMGTPEFVDSTEDILAARKLGIEALKEVERLRSHIHYRVQQLLPGETPAKPLYALGFNTGDDESP